MKISRLAKSKVSMFLEVLSPYFFNELLSLVLFQVYESTELPPEYKRNKAGQIEMLGDR